MLLQRHSNQLNEGSSNVKINSTTRLSRAPLTMTLCDSEKQLFSTQLNLTDNDSLLSSKRTTNKNDNNQPIRFNFKQQRSRTTVSNYTPDNPRASLKRAYSVADSNNCKQVISNHLK